MPLGFNGFFRYYSPDLFHFFFHGSAFQSILSIYLSIFLGIYLVGVSKQQPFQRGQRQPRAVAMASSDVFGGWGWGLGPREDVAGKMQREIKWKHTENTARQLAKLTVKTEDLHDYKLKPCVGNRRQYQAASTQPHFFTITRCAFPSQARALVRSGDDHFLIQEVEAGE